MKLVYLDLDGVLFDLHTALVEHTGIALPMENRNKLFRQYLPDFAAHGGFATIPVLESAHELIVGLVGMNCHLAILTSGGSFYERSEIARQKKVCVDNNFPALESVPFCITSSGASKSVLANKKSFLIDDHAPNIERFVEAGGHGVVYHPGEYRAVLAQVRSFLDA